MRRVIYAVNAALPASPSVKASPDGPGTGSAEQRRYVREVFSAIAPTYDLLNHVLSVNVDRSWRERALARPGFRGSVVGAAFALPMLRRGAGEADGRALRAGSDALEPPFREGPFDGATVGVSSLEEIGGRDGRSDRRRGAPVSGAERGGPSGPGQGRAMPRPGPGGPPKPQPKPLRAPVPPRPQPHPVRRPTPNRRGR